MTLFCVADTIYVATCNPVSLYSMKERGDTIHCMDLYDVFPRSISGVWEPFVTVAPLGSPLEGQVVLHEEQVGTPWCTLVQALVLCSNQVSQAEILFIH